ncbi:MAG: hypothetical protein AAF484_08455 [Pseudomonadota bacterium]
MPVTPDIGDGDWVAQSGKEAGAQQTARSGTVGRKIAAILCDIMRMAQQFLSRISSSAASVPPMRFDVLWPFAVILAMWVALTSGGFDQKSVFVLVVVSAEALILWRNLPRAARDLGRVSSNHADRLVWPVLAILGLIALQLLVLNPIFTQRLVSAGCVFVLVVMLFGVRREQQIMGVVMQSVRSAKPLSSPVPLMRVNAIFATALLIFNELLIFSGSLVVWMTAMVIVLLAMRSVYWFVVFLVTPDGETQDD